MAQPIYGVIVSFGIIKYEGEWTGQEKTIEDQCVIRESPSREYAELLFKRLCEGKRPLLDDGVSGKNSDSSEAKD